MKTKLLLVFLFVLLATQTIVAQQGTVIIRDRNSNTQAEVTSSNALLVDVSGGGPGTSVSISACSGATCYTAGVMSGLTVLASGSTSTIFTVSTLLQSARCNNATAAAVNVTITDGNNAYFVGPNFSLPASSNVEFQPNIMGAIMASGIRASAGTSSAINCWFVGKQ